MLTTYFASNQNFINASGFGETYSLRSELLATDEAGFIFNAMKKEIWKDIKGYEGFYQISNLGKVKSLKRTISFRRNGVNNTIKVKTIILSPGKYRGGYLQVSLNKRGKGTTNKMHRLVGQAFIPNPENKPCINHLNGIKTNNYAQNLEWCTYEENNRHAIKHKLNQMQGEHHPLSKLTEIEVLEIRKLRKKGYKIILLANKFNICKGNVSLITSRKAWKHI